MTETDYYNLEFLTQVSAHCRYCCTVLKLYMVYTSAHTLSWGFTRASFSKAIITEEWCWKVLSFAFLSLGPRHPWINHVTGRKKRHFNVHHSMSSSVYSNYSKQATASDNPLS
jgi:hypothetical protein